MCWRNLLDPTIMSAGRIGKADMYKTPISWTLHHSPLQKPIGFTTRRRSQSTFLNPQIVQWRHYSYPHPTSAHTKSSHCSSLLPYNRNFCVNSNPISRLNHLSADVESPFVAKYPHRCLRFGTLLWFRRWLSLRKRRWWGLLETWWRLQKLYLIIIVVESR